MPRRQSGQTTGALELYIKGVPIRECAEIAGVSISSLYRALNRHGVVLPSQRPFVAKSDPAVSGE